MALGEQARAGHELPLGNAAVQHGHQLLSMNNNNNNNNNDNDNDNDNDDDDDDDDDDDGGLRRLVTYHLITDLFHWSQPACPPARLASIHPSTHTQRA